MKNLTHNWIALVCLLIAEGVHAADSTLLSERDRSIRNRYEQVLQRNPFHTAAFNRVFDSYLKNEGLDAWVGKLATWELKDGQKETARVLQAQTHERKMDFSAALKLVNQLIADGYKHPKFDQLAGNVYYRTGDDEKAAELLDRALSGITDLDERTKLCRILGHIHLRRGKREQAIEVWKRIVEQNSSDVFALSELAVIYEENRMWKEAIGVHRDIIKVSGNDPYRRCLALRNIGIAELQSNQHTEAIAAYEKAIELVAPGNWMFEDLKLRLVSVYHDLGDLEGLLKYLGARIEAAPGDLDFRLIRAETFLRMERQDDAEKELLTILERRPRDQTTYEELLSLYDEKGDTPKVVATFEKLITMFPNDADYIRRLGEHHLSEGNREKAKATWRRALSEEPTTSDWVLLAGWFEGNELAEDAIAAYESALKLRSDREWTLRLAELKFEIGETEAAKKLWLGSLTEDSSAAEHAEIAMILEFNQLIDEADKLFRKTLELAPEDHETRARLARSLMGREKFKEALEEYDTLVKQSDSEYLRRQAESGQLDVYRRMGILPQKQAEWEKALEADTNSIPNITRLIGIYERAGRKPQALALHERLAGLKPDDFNVRRGLGQAYSRSQRSGEAIELFSKLADEDRSRARVHLQDLLHLYNRGFNNEKAIETAKRIVALAPADPETHLQLAQTYKLHRRNDEALNEFRVAARLNPEESKYWQQYGELLVKEKKWAEAQLAYQRMLDAAATPEMRIAALGGLTKVARGEGRLDGLVSELSARVRATPKKQAVYEDLAHVYLAAEQAAKAVETMEEGLPRVDERSPMLRSLIRFSYDAKDFDRVRKYYEKLVGMRARPSVFEYERLGRIYARTGDNEKALETWQKIRDEYPDNFKILNRVASVYELEKFYEEAVELRKELLRRNPNDTKGHYAYARLLVKDDQIDGAFAELFKLFDAADPMLATNKPNNSVSGMYATIVGGTVVRSPRVMIGRYSVSPYMFLNDLKRYVRPSTSSSRRSAGVPWSGQPNSRKGLMADMIAVAQQHKRADKLSEELHERIDRDPENAHLLGGVITLHEGLGDMTAAADAALKFSKLKAGDDALEIKAALYLNEGGGYDEAIGLLDGVIERGSNYKSMAEQCRIATLLRAGRTDDSIAYSRKLIAADDANADSMRSMIGTLMMQKRAYGFARELYEKVLSKGGSQAFNAEFQLGQIAMSESKRDEALERYTRLVLGHKGQMGPRYSSTRTLYRPSSSRRYSVTFQPYSLGMPSVAGRPNDYYRAQAFYHMVTLLGDFENSEQFKEMKMAISQYKEAKEKRVSDLRWDYAKMLIGYYMSKKRYDDIVGVLEDIHKQGRNDVEWYNMMIFTRHVMKDYDAMDSLYADYKKRYPQESSKVSSAQSAMASIRSANHSPISSTSTRGLTTSFLPSPLVSAPRPATIASRLASIGRLQKARPDLALRLLNSEIARKGRSLEMLEALATFNMDAGKTNAALSAIKEAWAKRKTDGSRALARKTFFVQGASSYRSSIKVDPLLSKMSELFRRARKLPDLLNYLEQRAKAEPQRENQLAFAQACHFNLRITKAINAYEQLVRHHGNYNDAEKTLARLKGLSGKP